MLPLDFRVRRAQERAIAVLARGLGMSDVVARVLLGRGIDELAAAQRFVAPRLGELRPPAGLAGFERGVGRIAAAVTAGHAIGVFGDYDVDGVTTAALLTSFLRSVGAHVEVQVAHREQGYGFSVEVAQELLARGAQLIITGDCGTSDLAALELVRDRGVDVVIIDHHTVPEKGQAHPSYALINPLCDDSTFPFRGMASVGLAFYVAGAVRTKLRQLGHFTARGLAEPDVRELLDLVALGTIADLVPLTDENRILVTHGLKRLAARARPGLAALLAQMEIAADAVLDEKLVSWRLAPRLNAPGRLGAAEPALALLLADSASAAERAAAVEDANTQRRAVQDRLYAEALELLGPEDPGPAIVIGKEGWPAGVVGIIAAKLVDLWQRPAFVVGVDPTTKEGRGSARSAGGVNLYQALHQAAAHLQRYGGHAAAAGFSVRADDPAWLEELRAALTASVTSLTTTAMTTQTTTQTATTLTLTSVTSELSRDGISPAVLDAADASAEAQLARGSGPAQTPASAALDRTLQVDAELPLARVTLPLLRELEQLAPFGQANPAPRLVVRNVLVLACRRVGDGSHAQLTLGDGASAERRAIFFRAGERVFAQGQRLDVVFTPTVSVWNGRERIDLEVVETFEAGVTGLAARPVSGGAHSTALAATLDSAALAATLDPAAP